MRQSLATAGYFTLVNMSNKVYAETQPGGLPVFITDVNRTVRDCIMNNSIEIESVWVKCVNETFLVNVSMGRLVDLANRELGITLTYYVHDVWVMDSAPMEVTFWVNVSYNVSDTFASWTVHGDILSVPISAKSVPDPFYEALRARGTTTESRGFNLTGLRWSQFDATSFDLFYENRSYMTKQGLAPSVLMRYEGDTGPSACCGIESLINRDSLASSTNYQNYSMTDHQMILHIVSPSTKFNCRDGEVRTYVVSSGNHLGLDLYTYDNPYNISKNLARKGALCSYP